MDSCGTCLKSVAVVVVSTAGCREGCMLVHALEYLLNLALPAMLTVDCLPRRIYICMTSGIQWGTSCGVREAGCRSLRSECPS